MSFVMAAGAVQAYGQVQQGRLAKLQADGQAQQLDYQAKVENENALKTAAIIRKAGKRQVAQTVEGYAGAGVKVGEGSAGEVEQQVTKNVEHDAYQAILDGSRRASGLETDATFTRADGVSRQSAADIAASSTIMSSSFRGMRANGWRTGGNPGFSGQQAPAPVTDLSRPRGSY